MNRSSRPKINKETVYLKYVSDQMELTDIHRTCRPIATQYILLKHNGIFSKKSHMLGHNINHMLDHNTEIISHSCSDHNSMKTESNNRNKTKNRITKYGNKAMYS